MYKKGIFLKDEPIVSNKRNYVHYMLIAATKTHPGFLTVEIKSRYKNANKNTRKDTSHWLIYL